MNVSEPSSMPDTARLLDKPPRLPSIGSSSYPWPLLNSLNTVPGLNLILQVLCDHPRIQWKRTPSILSPVYKQAITPGMCEMLEVRRWTKQCLLVAIAPNGATIIILDGSINRGPFTQWNIIWQWKWMTTAYNNTNDSCKHDVDQKSQVQKSTYYFWYIFKNCTKTAETHLCCWKTG